ncbi:hypothetical protein ACFFHJ_41650 [Planotetraspora thailandica]|uniref:hypothetical protein n=1 Tax=Planotetraspora thailandica TaxID=487172 RepID=UPI0019509D11|nr:hypothetical protein [Planotetraspora thailandica]
MEELRTKRPDTWDHVFGAPLGLRARRDALNLRMLIEGLASVSNSENLRHHDMVDLNTISELANAVADLLPHDLHDLSSIGRIRSAFTVIMDFFDEWPVDVSGLDLSRLTLNLEVLRGVVWTAETRWPADIAEQVQSHSHEVRPGVFEVIIDGSDDRTPTLINV